MTSFTNLLQTFPEQLRTALNARIPGGTSTPFPVRPQHILFFGMGGSGSAVAFLLPYLQRLSPIPLLLFQDYEIPRTLSHAHALHILISHSGNTEETLTIAYYLQKQQLPFIAITSNGILKELARARHLPVLELNPDLPPRFTLPAQTGYILTILARYIPAVARELPHLQQFTEHLHTLLPQIQDQSQQLSELARHKLTIIATDTLASGVALRWKQQWNENAKHPLHPLTFPEASHNELEATNLLQTLPICVFLLHHHFIHPRTQLHLQFFQQQFPPSQTHTIHPPHNLPYTSPLTQLLYLLWLGDWTSCYLAQKIQVDPISVPTIQQLKQFLQAQRQ